MSTDLVVAPAGGGMTPEQIDLITRTVARGCSKDELALFFHACVKTGLDPLMKQIYAVKRWDSTLKRETMAIQTGIDGLRLVAERSHEYAPGREPSFAYKPDGSLNTATAYVKKFAGGVWHEVGATAFYDEYVQTKKTDRGPEPTTFWKKMPHVMLAKVAEALALRRAFPMDLSGIYSNEEMTQADVEHAAQEKFPRLRGVKAQAEETRTMAELDTPAVEGKPADVDAAGEDGGVVGGEESGSVGRADRPDGVAERRKKNLEKAVNEFAKTWDMKPSDLRDRVKQRMMDEFDKEHFVELNPLEYAKVLDLWLAGEALR